MGLTIIKPDININFIGARKIAFAVSILLIILGVASLVVKGGPKYGIDFAGGMIVQVKFEQGVTLEEIRESLAAVGKTDLVVQRFDDPADNKYLIHFPSSFVEKKSENAGEEERNATLSNLVDEAFDQGLMGKKHEIQRTEMVGPKVAVDLRDQALNAMFYAVLLIAIYISGRFEQRWMAAALMAGCLAGSMYLLGLFDLAKSVLTMAAMVITLFLCWKIRLNYALGAVVALIHDVLITVGIFSLLNKEFDLTTVAALLTIIGYSLNDTIIVFDRIRENIRGKAVGNFGRVINDSINQTLSRTLLTSGTTLLVVFSLYLLGGGVIHDFALALLIGVAVGTYSSVFVASPILLAFVPKEDLEAQA